MIDLRFHVCIVLVLLALAGVDTAAYAHEEIITVRVTYLAVGMAIGFMPDRGNESFSADMPRYGGFAHVEVGRRRGPRYAAEVSYNEIRPTGDLLNHRFAGLSHSFRWQGLALRHDVQLDRDPETGRWVASRFNVHGSA